MQEPPKRRLPSLTLKTQLRKKRRKEIYRLTASTIGRIKQKKERMYSSKYCTYNYAVVLNKFCVSM